MTGRDDPFPAIDALLTRLQEEAARDEQERTRALLRAVLDAHAAALEKLLALVRARADGEGLLAALAHDPLIGRVLVLHDLHPLSLAERVQAALRELAPRLAAQHAAVGLLVPVTEGSLKLRLEHHGKGAVRSEVEAALAAAAPEASPEIEEVLVAPLHFQPRSGRAA
ncbi:MAG: hypothetical protein P4L83_14170 [Nevskia sp.]|nr:hypothetical protein [Nevskia sp.]